MSQRPPCPERFFSNLKCFRSIIKDGLKKEKSSVITPEFVDLAFELLETMDKEMILLNFIERTNSLWTEISEGRDLAAILDQSFVLFGGISEDKVQEITRLATKKNGEGGQDIDLAWKLVDGLIRISIKYIHEKRRPFLNSSGELSYENPNFFSDIDIVKHAGQYRLNLTTA